MWSNLLKLALALLLGCSARAELIPAVRLVDWTPGTATGVPGGIPTTRTMYVNALTGELGGGGSYGGTLAAGDGTTDDRAAIQAMLNSCPSGKYVYLPAATYKLGSALFINPSQTLGANNTTLRGDGQTTILSVVSGSAISVGPTAGFTILETASAADMLVSAGLSKGSSQVTIGSTTTLAANMLVRFEVADDSTIPDVSVKGYDYTKQQIVRVTSVLNGTQFTFAPTLYSDYGAGALTARTRAALYNVEGVGIEDLKILLLSGAVGASINQGYGCWIKGVRVTDTTNYGLQINDSLKCEIRRCTIDPRNGAGTSGAALFTTRSSAAVVEDNIVFGEWIAAYMGNDGDSGNFVSRNWAETTNNFSPTHDGNAPQFNLIEGNAIPNGVIKVDGYFGSANYLTMFNNYAITVSVYRLNRYSNVVGNYSVVSVDVTGHANFGSDSSIGFSTYYPGDYSDPWDDFGMTGTLDTVTQGTGTGYLVDGVHNIGDTTIQLKTGTGTIVIGDIVTFAGHARSYYVVSFSGGILTINEGGHERYTGEPGLSASVANDAAVTITSIAPGTASGYLVNNGAGYGIGDTVITVDTGTGTIKAGEIVTFSGAQASLYRYRVVSLSGSTLTIDQNTLGTTGLVTTIADNATITVSQDRGVVSYSNGTLPANAGFGPIDVNLNWGTGGAVNQQFGRAASTATKVLVVPYSSSTVNTVALPAQGTTIVRVGPGSTGYQERDLAVALTMIRKGNRYQDDGHFDSLGGDTLPSSLAYGEIKPQWLTDAESEFPTATFNLRPFDPVGGTPPSSSDIPAGYRAFLLVDPAFVSAGINAGGTELSITMNKPMSIGVGGSGGVTLTGNITATYSRTSGSSVVYTLSRIVTEGEEVQVSYTQPGNGIEATSNGNDLASFTNESVSNSSSATQGVSHIGPDVTDMTSDYSYPDSSEVRFSKIVMTENGNATAIRWWIDTNVFQAACRVVLCELDGTVISSSPLNSTVSGVDRWQSMAITSVPVTAGQTYLAGVQFLGNGDPVLRQLTAQGANSSYVGTHAFGSAFPATITPTGDTALVAIQLRYIAEPPIYTPGKLRILRR